MSEQTPVHPPGSVFEPPGQRRQSEDAIVIPDHELLRCVGSGSYGEVWLARSVVGTFRAVKIVFRKAFRDHHPFDRELTGIRQFEPISRSHEGFVDVLQIGRNDEAGYFYYIMELGDDEKSGQRFDPDTYSPKTLAKEISTRGKLPVDECVQLGATLCGALRHLHDHGLIHRDIKPANIIFVDGMPKLADIGLVANIEEANSYVGTDGFAPPEGPNSFSADLYSLGKVLYEASTCFDRTLFPRMPAKFTSTEDASSQSELNEVLNKACQGASGQRYQSASEMQADLAILQSGRSVHRVRVLERRWSKAKRVIAIGSALLVAAALVAFQINRRQKLAAERRQRDVGAQVAYGIQNMKAGDFSAALPYFVEALRLDQGDELREFTHRLRLAALLNRCPKLSQFWRVDEDVWDARFTPDGRNVLVGSSFLEIAPAQPAALGKQGAKTIPVKYVVTAAMSPDGRFVLIGSYDSTASLWDTRSRLRIQTYQHPQRVYDAEFSPDGTTFVTACEDGTARIWGIDGGPPIRTFAANTNEMLHAEFSPNGELLVTSGQDNAARLWNVRSGAQVGAPMGHKDWVFCASFSPDGQYVVTAGYDHKARLWSVPDGKQFGIAMEHADGVHSTRFSPDGRYIVTASYDGTARLWDAKSGAPVKENAILKHSSGLRAASFSPDGSQIVTVCGDGTVRVWDLSGSVAVPRALNGTASPDGRYCALGTNDLIRIEETAASGRQLPPIPSAGVVTNTIFNRDSRFLLALRADPSTPGQTNTSIGVWNTESGRMASPSITSTNPVTCACLSDDGHLLAFGATNFVRVIGLAEGRDIWPPYSPDADCSGVAFAPSGASLAIYGGNQVVVLDTTTGKPRYPALHLDTEVKFVDFSPKSDVFITCLRDDPLIERCAQLWDTLTGKPVGLPLWHRDGVLSARFNSDGDRVVTTSEDFTAIVWNTRTSEPVTDPLSSGEQVFGASFTKDGRWVVTASFDRTVRLWDAQTGDLLAPPLENPDHVRDAMVMEGNNRVVVSGLHGGVWVWELPQDKHSLDDLKGLAHLLLGNARHSKRGTLEENVRLLQEAWEKLTATHPEDFRSTPAQIIAWHENEAEAARRGSDPFGMQFHKRWLRERAVGKP